MTFRKGVSGNPGGRPKEEREVLKLARERSVEAVERLTDWMRSENPRVSILASEALLNRAIGKPKTVQRQPPSPERAA
jgi:hypothetical protein